MIENGHIYLAQPPLFKLNKSGKSFYIKDEKELDNFLISNSKSLKKVNTDEADRLNMLGFTARKSGDLDAAGDYYQQALALNPRHTGALEYQGELFIQLGKIELAKANLAKIDKICWLPCNAERELKKAIENSITN